MFTKEQQLESLRKSTEDQKKILKGDNPLKIILVGLGVTISVIGLVFMLVCLVGELFTALHWLILTGRIIGFVFAIIMLILVFYSIGEEFINNQK